MTTTHAELSVEFVRHVLENPDGCDPDDLDNACNWIGWGDNPACFAANIWPDGGADRANTLTILRRYMSCKSAAMRWRAKGGIAAAQELEAKCEIIYDHQLPEWAKW